MSENGDIQGKTIEATAEDLSALTKELVTDPEVLAKFGKKLMSYVGKSSGYIEGLPKSIKRRVRALRKLQLEVFKVESKFYEEVHRLEAKYAELCKPLFNKRSEIINAAKEPTDSECEWESEDEEHECHKEGGDCCDHEAMAGESDKPDILDSKFDEDTKGIPMFWYTALKNTPMVDQMVMTHDEEALKTLKDIRVTYNGESEEEMYFELHFEFEENRFFEDKILTKKYHLKLEPSTTYPMNYEGPEIYKSTGCTVNWKEGMNLTSVDDVKKMNPDVETEEFSSFFDLFKSCQMDDVADKDLSENERAIKENNNLMDFEVGQLLQSSIIPKAVLYFTGEMCVDDDEDDDDDEDEEGEGEYDEDEDPDYTPSKGKGQECKQQ